MKKRLFTLAFVVVIVLSLSISVHANMPNLAISAGYNFPDGMDTRQDAIDASNTYSSIGYNTVTLTNASLSDFSGTNLLAGIMFFSGHGNNDWINIGNIKIVCQNVAVSDSTYVNLWNTVANQNLIVFAGCKTAAPEPYTLSSVTKRAFNQGAAATVGWITEVAAGSHSNWLQRFNNALSIGLNVVQAKNVANSYSYLPGSGVKNVSVFCDEDVYITTPSSNINSSDCNISCMEMMYNPQNCDIFDNIIQKTRNNQSFEDEYVKCYSFPDSNSENRIVDVYFKINNCVSNASIVMLLDSNGNMISIWKYNIDNVNLSEFISKTEDLYVKRSTENDRILAQKNAIHKLNDGEQIIKQEQFDYYDVIENKTNLITYSTVVDKYGSYFVIDDITVL